MGAGKTKRKFSSMMNKKLKGGTTQLHKGNKNIWLHTIKKKLATILPVM